MVYVWKAGLGYAMHFNHIYLSLVMITTIVFLLYVRS